MAFHLLVVAAVVTMVNLGFWQLRRLDERREFNATVEARYDEPPVPLDSLLPAGGPPAREPADLEWLPVSATGTYLPDETFFVVNRSQSGRAGRNVVVPMELDDGRTLVVNRGFVPLDADVPAVPSTGSVEIVGRLRPSQERGLGQLSDPAEGELVEAQRIDLPRLEPQLPGDVVPMYVDLAVSDPPEAGPFPEPVAAPELTERNHLSYAVQWFIFSIAVAVGWVLAVRRSVERRRREAGEAACIETVLEFNDAINARDLDRLTARMTPDHRFVDAAGGTTEGIDACRDAWASFFESFPDYRNVLTETRFVAPRSVVAVGRSECSFAPLDGPAVWHARVEHGAVAEWRVDDRPD